MHSHDIRTRAGHLERFWKPRNKKFKEWYEQIRMVDTLEQRDMESFVGNDPRASFNLISSLLNQKIPHRLQPDRLNPEQVAPAAELSFMFEVIWENIFDQYRLRGRHYLDDLINFLLCTGWYTAFATMSLDGSVAISEIWNPATVYPMWDDKLVECAHIFQPGPQAISGMAQRNLWDLSGYSLSSTTAIYDYWWLEKQLTRDLVHNAIFIDNKVVKEDTIEIRYDRIPIFVSPVGGLPDNGYLSTRKTLDFWKQEIGQSFIATNENVYKTSNKWWSYAMQLIRDYAQPRTFERSGSSAKIVQPETWYRRAPHYKLGPNDEVGFITPPTLPVELRSTQLDLEAMMQRGGPSWAMFGALQQRMTAFAMSQIAATTHQVSKSFHKGVIECFTDMDNFYRNMIKNNGYKPYGISLPSGLPDNAKLTAEYELRIPGDLVQRATTARMLNPEFELSAEYIMEHNFPEIKSPMEELARVQAGRARRDPVYAGITLIESLRQEAQLLRNVDDFEGAKLYEKAADKKEREVLAEPQPAPGTQPPPEPRVRPEVRPPNAASLERGQ